MSFKDDAISQRLDIGRGGESHITRGESLYLLLDGQRLHSSQVIDRARNSWGERRQLVCGELKENGAGWSNLWSCERFFSRGKMPAG